MRSSRRADLLPHEVGELHEEDLVRDRSPRARRARCRWRGCGTSRCRGRGWRGRRSATISQACGELVDVPAPGQRLVGDADAERHREHRQLAAGRARATRGRRVACAEVDEQASSTLRAERVAHLEHRLGDVDLVGVQVARQALEVAQHLEAGDAQAALAHRAIAAASPPGWPTMSRGVQHHLREAGVAHRAQLGLERPGERDRVHAEVVEVHGLQVTHDQLEGDAAEVDLGERALVARLHRAAVDEHDAALAAARAPPRARRARRGRRAPGPPPSGSSSAPGGGSISCR